MHRRVIHECFDCTVKGKEKGAQILLDAKPELLLINTEKTTDYSGKLIEGLTVFQAALCAGDVDMVKMLLPYFDALDEGDHHRSQQIQAIFPDGLDAHLAHQLDDTFDFSTVVTAISTASDIEVSDALNLTGAAFKQSDSERSKPDSELSLVEALNRFREKFTEKSLKERIHNPQHLLKALELCSSNFEPENDAIWSGPKRQLFWRQIVGFCQRFVPACMAQAFAQGLTKLVSVPGSDIDDGTAQQLKRSLSYRFGGGDFYPIASSSQHLGFRFAASVTAAPTVIPGWGRGPNSLVRYFKAFISAKATSMCDVVSASTTHSRTAHP
ncbi:MAG: hypothetical protein P1U34_07250 [Coxiellaceae bacterium]|nr:hypothetical protein [Coxiellaceae bacterium]